MVPRTARRHSTHDLSPSERLFVTVLRDIGFGHLESIKIRHGAIVFDPWPTVVRVLKFGAAERRPPSESADLGWHKSVAELFEYIRGVDDGEIRRLDVRHGLPFSMEVERISRGMPDVKGEHVETV
jgi:hypothetical protein